MNMELKDGRGDEGYKIIILTVLKDSLQLAGFCLPYLYEDKTVVRKDKVMMRFTCLTVSLFSPFPKMHNVGVSSWLSLCTFSNPCLATILMCRFIIVTWLYTNEFI